MEESGIMVLSKAKHAVVDFPRIMEECESGPGDDQLSMSNDIQALGNSALTNLLPLFACPSYYSECLNTFMDLCPSPDKENLLYLSCKLYNCLISAANARLSITDGSPLRVLSILGRETDFDVWFLHNLMMYHSTGLGTTIYYDVVKPSQSQNGSSHSAECPLSGLFVQMANCQNFEPTERYDIILLSHSLDDLPPSCLTTIFDGLLISDDHAFMIVMEGTPTEKPNPGIDEWVMLDRHTVSYLEDKLSCLDPDASIYEIISVNCWMDVEKVCRESENLDVQLLSFCMGKDLRNLEAEDLRVIQEEVTFQILFRRCESPASNSSCFAVVSRMDHL